MKYKYTCPACGYLSFDEPPGSDEICHICFWHDDITQLRFPIEGGANHTSLVRAQENYEEYGAVEKRLMAHTKKPDNTDEKDKAWRKIDFTHDQFDALPSGKNYLDRFRDIDYPEDSTHLYYWSSNYWKNKKTNI